MINPPYAPSESIRVHPTQLQFLDSSVFDSSTRKNWISWLSYSFRGDFQTLGTLADRFAYSLIQLNLILI